MKQVYGQEGCGGNVTRVLRHECSGRLSCSLSVPNRALDDEVRANSCGETRTYLNVTYKCLQGQYRHHQYRHHSSITPFLDVSCSMTL